MNRSFILAVICSWASVAVAQEVSTAGTMDLDEALSLAMERNPELAAARLAAEEARAQLDQAGRWPNPELDLEGYSDAPFNDEGEETLAAGLIQSVSFSGRIGARRSVAQSELDAALAEVADQERNLSADVRRAYVEVLVIQERIKVEDLVINLSQESLDAAKAAFDRAEASEKDVSAADIEMQQAMQRRRVLENDRLSQQFALNRLVGNPPDQVFVATGSLDLRAESIDTSATLENVLRHRPDYQLARYRVARAEAELRLAKSERYEDARVGAHYEREKSVVDGAAPQGVDEFVGVSVSVPLPVFDRKQGLVRASGLAVERSRKEAEALQFEIAHELADARNRIQANQPFVSTFSTGLLHKAEANARLVEQGFSQGQLDFIEVIQARQQLAELHSSYIDMLQAYHLAVIDFEAASATGTRTRSD
jgi:cobalt-zinc-cadmium efflux system outer membrane protein